MKKASSFAAAAACCWSLLSFVSATPAAGPVDLPDVAGLRLGMSRAEIADVLHKSGARSIQEFDSQLAFWDPVAGARVSIPDSTFKTAFWASDGVGTYNIFFSPESGRERPVQIRYTVSLNQGTWVAEPAFVASVTGKYGAPSAAIRPTGQAEPGRHSVPPGMGVLAWSSGKGSIRVGEDSPCYQYANDRRNELSRNSAQVNNPVFDSLGSGPVPVQGDIVAACGDRYLLVQYTTATPGDPLGLQTPPDKRLVTGYWLVLVDAKASVESALAAKSRMK